MVPIPNSNVAFGQAKEMSRNDKARLNTLYKCCKFIRELYNSTATVLGCVESLNLVPLTVD